MQPSFLPLGQLLLLDRAGLADIRLQRLVKASAAVAHHVGHVMAHIQVMSALALADAGWHLGSVIVKIAHGGGFQPVPEG